MKWILVLFFSFLGSAVSAQTHLDSLQSNLSHAQTIDEKIDAINALAENYRLVQYDSCIHYATKALDLAEKSDYDFGKYQAYLSIFWALNTRANYVKALEVLLKCQQLAEILTLHRSLALTQVNDYLGLLNMEMGNFPEAIALCRKTIIMYASNTEKTHGEWSGYSVMATVYLRQNKLDSALWYAQKSYDLSIAIPVREDYRSLVFAILGNVYTAQGNLQIAKNYYRLGMDDAIKNKKPYLLARIYYNYASLLRREGNIDSCIHFGNASLELCRIYNYANYAKDASKVLTDAYELKKDPDSALKYIKVMVAQQDSIFSQQKVTQFLGLISEEKKRQDDIEAAKARFQNQLKIYGLLAVIAVFILLAIILTRNNIQRRKSNHLLQSQKQELETTLQELKSAQNQLIQAEKMASLGELTAGIAHEIQSPLNFVNNFSEVSLELMEEMKTEITTGHPDEANRIAGDIENNLEKVVHHGKRADAIVKGMLLHSRISSGQKEPADLNALVDEYLRISYHGLRAKNKQFNSAIQTDFDPAVGKVNIVPQDIGRALINLFNNAFYAVHEKFNSMPDKSAFEPTLYVQTRKIKDKTEIRVKDNGNGIPQKILDKIFQPFFTTKPTGEGTGLGLSLTYDIITKEHGGTLKVETREGAYTEFIILI